MQPGQDQPGPFPRPAAPGTSRATPAAAAAAITRHLGDYGITRTYTATCDRYAVISVATGLAVWTNGRVLWWHHPGQPGTWPAADTPAAAARLAALARLGTP